MRIRNTALLLTGRALALGLSIAVAGYIGFSQSMRVMTTPAAGALVSSVVPMPPPVHDPRKPTVAVLLGNTFSEPTDVLGPYAMFAESGAYNVYTVAASRTLRTLTGGLDLVPHLSFEQLADRLHGDPDIVVVPQIVDIRASSNAPVVAWVKQQGRGHALLFSWCTGSEALAESGVLDGKAATAHWGDIDRLQRTYPRVDWQRGVRYVDGGALLSTAGLTAGLDATLRLLTRRHGAGLAARVAGALHVPPSPFVENPKCPQFEFTAADGIFLLNAGFGWPKPRISLWLYDGADELDLGAVLDVYGISAVHQIQTRSATRAVVSRHGIQFVAREQAPTVPPMARPDSLSPAEGSLQFAYIAAVEDLARQQDTWTARFAAKRLEIRTPLHIAGPAWSAGAVLAALFIGCATVGFLIGLKRAAGKQRQAGLELKVPPVALGVITAGIMGLAQMATPDFDVPLPSTAALPLGIALLGALTCLAGVVSFRRAKTTVNPMRPDATFSLVVSGIYRYTRNPMYLGFLLILLAWAAALSNVLALAWLPVFVVYMNRFQISPKNVRLPPGLRRTMRIIAPGRGGGSKGPGTAITRGAHLMEYLIGVGLAAAVCVFAMLSGFDRERVFYSTVGLVVAHYYILFAAMGSSMPALARESLAAAVFVTLATIGFKKNLWLTAAALAGHGAFDSVHHLLIQNPGGPVWWPGFCLPFDVLAGGFLAVLLMRRSRVRFAQAG